MSKKQMSEMERAVGSEEHMEGACELLLLVSAVSVDAPGAAMCKTTVAGTDSYVQWLRKLVSGMEESTTYQEIFNKGVAIGLAKVRRKEARKLLVLAGKEHLGVPDAAVRRKLRTFDLNRLHLLARHVLRVRSWRDLLAVE